MLKEYTSVKKVSQLYIIYVHVHLRIAMCRQTRTRSHFRKCVKIQRRHWPTSSSTLSNSDISLLWYLTIAESWKNIQTPTPPRPGNRIPPKSHVTVQILFWFIVLNSFKFHALSTQIEKMYWQENVSRIRADVKWFYVFIKRRRAARTVSDISSDSPEDSYSTH